MNTYLRSSKYKLHQRPFNTDCSGIYSESLDGMPLILVLLQNDLSAPPSANFYQSLARCYLEIANDFIRDSH